MSIRSRLNKKEEVHIKTSICMVETTKTRIVEESSILRKLQAVTSTKSRTDLEDLF